MAQIKNICVFCSASDDVADLYKAAARNLGQIIADEGFHLVYGGTHVGLMGATADAVLARGGEVTGVFPEFLKSREVMHTGLTALHITETMQQRQKKMSDLADAFIILPGGLGTLAEFFEILTWRLLDLHSKPIIIANINNYWDSLLETMQNGAEQGFMHGELGPLLRVVEDIEGLGQAVRALKNQ